MDSLKRLEGNKLVDITTKKEKDAPRWNSSATIDYHNKDKKALGVDPRIDEAKNLTEKDIWEERLEKWNKRHAYQDLAASVLKGRSLEEQEKKTAQTLRETEAVADAMQRYALQVAQKQSTDDAIGDGFAAAFARTNKFKELTTPVADSTQIGKEDFACGANKSNLKNNSVSKITAISIADIKRIREESRARAVAASLASFTSKAEELEAHENAQEGPDKCIQTTQAAEKVPAGERFTYADHKSMRLQRPGAMNDDDIVRETRVVTDTGRSNDEQRNTTGAKQRPRSANSSVRRAATAPIAPKLSSFERHEASEAKKQAQRELMEKELQQKARFKALPLPGTAISGQSSRPKTSNGIPNNPPFPNDHQDALSTNIQWHQNAPISATEPFSLSNLRCRTQDARPSLRDSLDAAAGIIEANAGLRRSISAGPESTKFGVRSSSSAHITRHSSAMASDENAAAESDIRKRLAELEAEIQRERESGGGDFDYYDVDGDRNESHDEQVLGQARASVTDSAVYENIGRLYNEGQKAQADALDQAINSIEAMVATGGGANVRFSQGTSSAAGGDLRGNESLYHQAFNLLPPAVSLSHQQPYHPIGASLLSVPATVPIAANRQASSNVGSVMELEEPSIFAGLQHQTSTIAATSIPASKDGVGTEHASVSGAAGQPKKSMLSRQREWVSRREERRLQAQIEDAERRLAEIKPAPDVSHAQESWERTKRLHALKQERDARAAEELKLQERIKPQYLRLAKPTVAVDAKPSEIVHSTSAVTAHGPETKFSRGGSGAASVWTGTFDAAAEPRKPLSRQTATKSRIALADAMSGSNAGHQNLHAHQVSTEAGSESSTVDEQDEGPDMESEPGEDPEQTHHREIVDTDGDHYSFASEKGPARNLAKSEFSGPAAERINIKQLDLLDLYDRDGSLVIESGRGTFRAMLNNSGIAREDDSHDITDNAANTGARGLGRKDGKRKKKTAKKRKSSNTDAPIISTGTAAISNVSEPMNKKQHEMWVARELRHRSAREALAAQNARLTAGIGSFARSDRDLDLDGVGTEIPTRATTLSITKPGNLSASESVKAPPRVARARSAEKRDVSSKTSSGTALTSSRSTSDTKAASGTVSDEALAEAKLQNQQLRAQLRRLESGSSVKMRSTQMHTRASEENDHSNDDEERIDELEDGEEQGESRATYKTSDIHKSPNHDGSPNDVLYVSDSDSAEDRPTSSAPLVLHSPKRSPIRASNISTTPIPTTEFPPSRVSATGAIASPYRINASIKESVAASSAFGQLLSPSRKKHDTSNAMPLSPRNISTNPANKSIEVEELERILSKSRAPNATLLHDWPDTLEPAMPNSSAQNAFANAERIRDASTRAGALNSNVAAAGYQRFRATQQSPQSLQNEPSTPQSQPRSDFSSTQSGMYMPSFHSTPNSTSSARAISGYRPTCELSPADDPLAPFFDPSSTTDKGRLRLHDAREFETESLHRRPDIINEYVTLLMGIRRAGSATGMSSLRAKKEEIVTVLFDRSEFSEKSAREWWTENKHRLL